MQKKSYPSKIFGIYILIFGVIILLKILFLSEFKFLYILLIIISIASCDLIIRSLISRKRRILIIPGTIILLSCIFFLVYLLIDPLFLYFGKIWPILGMFPATAMIIFYMISYKKRASIIVPGIFLFFLSIILILFTTSVINLPFTYFLLLLIPSMIILTGLYLIFRNEIIDLKNNINNKNSSRQ
jgi:hypothetical protein